MPVTRRTASADKSVPGRDGLPLLVKFKGSASSTDIANAVHGSGGTDVRDLKQLHIHVINVPAAARDRVLAAFAHHPAVERADAAVQLGKASIPNDPGYAQQWALPRIAWDQAFGAVSVTGTATIAVLDTG